MFQVEYFPLSKGEVTEAVNYIDYSTLTVNEGVVEIDNIQGTNSIFIPNINDFIDDCGDKTLHIKLKNLVPCKVIVVLEDNSGMDKRISFENFKLSYYENVIIDENIFSGICTIDEDPEGNFIIFYMGTNMYTTAIYEMKETKYKKNDVVESAYFVSVKTYKPREY